MILPQEGHDEPDLAAHYQRNKMKVLGALLLCNLAAYLAVVAVGAAPFDVPKMLHMGGFAALVAVLIALRNKATNIALLCVTCARYFAAML